jgi:hypothetical protein
MGNATTDRGAILHFAGFHHLSPAVDDRSRPAFSAGAGDGLVRCGWERFFAAMRAGDLALEFDPEDAGSARFVEGREARRAAQPGAALARSLEHARRFWKALRS